MKNKSAVPENKKGSIRDAGYLVNRKVRALSRFAQKSPYDKKPVATQVMPGKQIHWFLPEILDADDGNAWFVGGGTTGKLYRQERPSRFLK